MPLSVTQQKYLAIAWACFETEPKIDYEKFKQLAGLASAHSARELMRVTKKKLREEYGVTDGAEGTPVKNQKQQSAIKTPASRTSAGGRKRKATGSAKTSAGKADDGDDDDDDAGPGAATPTPRSAKPTPKKVKVEQSIEEDEELAVEDPYHADVNNAGAFDFDSF